LVLSDGTRYRRRAVNDPLVWCTRDGRTHLDVALGERIAAVSLVDDLSHADHVVVVVEDRHAQYRVGRVPRHVIDLPVEPRVLQTAKHTRFIRDHRARTKSTSRRSVYARSLRSRRAIRHFPARVCTHVLYKRKKKHVITPTE